MYPEVIRAFERNLVATSHIIERPDTVRARQRTADPWTFEHNLRRWCEREAFDRTVNFVARQFHTQNLDRIQAILRRAGLRYRGGLIYVEHKERVLH